MERAIPKFHPVTKRYDGDTMIDFIEGVPLDYWKAPDFHTFEPVPKYDAKTEIPVWDGKDWVVRPLSDFEEPEMPEPEPSLLNEDMLRKVLISIVDKVEKGTELPQEVKDIVEAERPKTQLEESR